MNKFSLLREAVFSLLIFAILFTVAMIGLLTYFGWMARLNASEWASWVQAVGSISAILISLGLASFQNERQRRSERSREAANDLRIAMFAEAVVNDALTSVRAVERAQKRWPIDSDYLFNDGNRILAAQRLTQMVATQPLFRELISPVMKLHALLITVQASAESLHGQCNFTSNSRFTQHWEHNSTEMVRIEAEVKRAVTLASRASEIAEKKLRHF